MDLTDGRGPTSDQTMEIRENRGTGSDQKMEVGKGEVIELDLSKL